VYTTGDRVGRRDGRSLLITSPAGFAELIARAATPAHLAGPDTKIDLELPNPRNSARSQYVHSDSQASETVYITTLSE
jgi:hypothetical protein